MKDATYSQAGVQAEMIAEALTLLRIIEAEHSNEDINESPDARETRILLRSAARQLVNEMVKAMRPPANQDAHGWSFAAAA